MSEAPRRRLSLGAQLAIVVFAVEILLMGGSLAWILRYTIRQSREAFDETLLSNAQALASVAEPAPDGDLRLELSDPIMDRFESGAAIDLYALVSRGGETLAGSPGLGRLPGFVSGAADAPQFGDFQLGGVPYRGVVIGASVHHANPEDRGETEESAEPRIPVLVFYASSTRNLDARLHRAARFFGWSGVLLLLISVPIAAIVAASGLRPVRRLAREMEAIGERDLGRRLPARELPPDLAPLAASVNGLLARLEVAFERERRFSADAAHELRTPLSTLMSGIQAALLSPPDTAEDRRALAELLEDVKRMEHLCESLLDLSVHGERPHGSARLTWGEWNDIVGGVVRSFEARAAESGATLAWHPGTALHGVPEAMVRADAGATRRIATNLVDNALKHGGPGISVRVSTRCVGADCVELVVEDDGPGIAPGDVPLLFERFFRADKARSRETGGAGLGLSICKALARSEGGDVRFERVEPRGTRFVWRAVSVAGE